MLEALFVRYEDLRERIAEDGGLRRFVNVYVRGEDIRFLDGLQTAVGDGDEITILPAVAGGQARKRSISWLAGPATDRLGPVLAASGTMGCRRGRTL